MFGVNVSVFLDVPVRSSNFRILTEYVIKLPMSPYIERSLYYQSGNREY